MSPQVDQTLYNIHKVVVVVVVGGQRRKEGKVNKQYCCHVLLQVGINHIYFLLFCWH
jgi:hypothetical protein